MQTIETLVKIFVLSLLLFNRFSTFGQLSPSCRNKLLDLFNLGLQEVLLVQLLLLILTVQVRLLVFKLGNGTLKSRIPVIHFVGVLLNLF